MVAFPKDALMPGQHLTDCESPRDLSNVSALCEELGITRQTLYRHVSPTGELREAGNKVLAQRR